MRLTNHTPYPAKLFRTSLDKTRLAASLALRVTFEWKNGRFEPSEEQDWIVSGPPFPTPYGEMPGDELFYRGGCDLFILGHARAPAGRAIPVMDVTAEINDFRYGVRVFGERVWQRGRGGLVPSAPQPITAIPLTLNHAFGGKVQWDGLEVPFGANPDGKGFYIDEESAEGRPLPNIEDPANLITKWDDRPLPVGMGACPANFAGRVFPLIDPVTSAFKFSARLFNAAFPAMVVPKVAAGDILTVRGISAGGDVKIPIPSARFAARLAFDDEIIDRDLPIDQLGLEFDKKRIFVSYRYPFRYVLHPRQQRSCTLSRIDA
jgi:hypothetical protein